MVTVKHNTLRGTLDGLLASRTGSDPAFDILLADYVKYHLVLVLAGGVVAVLFLVLGGFFWTRSRRARARAWTFERWTFAGFAALCAVTALLVAAVAAIDANTVLHPRPGFSLAVATLGTPAPGTPRAALDQSFASWIQSGRAAMPGLVAARVHARTTFQGTKAAYSAALLVVTLAVSAGLWAIMIRRSRRGRARWGVREGALVLAGAATVAFSLLLLVVVVANLQGALAPVAKTLFYG